MIGHFWSFFHSFLPVWVGAGVFAVWWIIRDYVSMRRRLQDIDMLNRAKVAHDDRIGRLENPTRQT